MGQTVVDGHLRSLPSLRFSSSRIFWIREERLDAIDAINGLDNRDE
jgi:hypothetical protein